MTSPVIDPVSDSLVDNSDLPLDDPIASVRSDRAAPSDITSHRLMAGTLSTLFNRFFVLAVAFFLTPFVVHSIGVEAYGLWAVMGSVVNYLGLLDCGVGSGFVKYLAEFLERREHNEVRQVMTFGALFYLGFGLVVLPLVYLLAPHIVIHLRLDARYLTAASNLLVLVVVYFVMSNMLGIFGAFVAAMQRTELGGLIDSFSHLVYAISLVIFLHLQYGVYAIPAAVFCALGAGALIKIGFVYRTFGNPWSNPFRWERQLLRRVFRFGFWMQVNALTSIINFETDRIILGTFVSVTSAGYYELGNRLSVLDRILPQALLFPLFPATSALDGRQDHDQINVVYLRGTRYMALITFVIAGFLIGAGPQILKVWMGQRLPYVTLIMAALLISYLVNNLTGVGTMIVRATGQPQYEAYYTIVFAIVNVALTLILTPFFGLMGVVGATVIGNIVGSFYFIWLFHRLRGLSWHSAIGSWLWPLTAGTTIASVILWMACEALPATWFDSRIDGFCALGGLGIAYLGLAWALLWILRFWKTEDSKLVHQVAKPLLVTQLTRFRSANT